MIRTLREWFFRFRGTWKAHDGGTAEELRFHLEMAEQDAVGVGFRWTSGTIAEQGRSAK
jgi:hypothetical protein